MGWAENLKQKMVEAGADGLLAKRQKLQNELVAQFVNNEIDLPSLRQGLGQLEEGTDFISLPFPGALYGLLRVAGVDQKTAREKTDEEKAHFTVATEAGLKSRIIIRATKGDAENERFLYIFLSYEIPDEIDPERMREIFRKISLAPLKFHLKPSPDDLAKLP